MAHLTCPFCNAAIPVPSPRHCPRCEERLPGGTATASPAKAATAGSPLWFRVGFPLSCVVSILALVGGLYFLNRGEAKPVAPATKSTRSDVGPATIPPLGLPALGYLPGNVSAVAAVQTKPLAAYAGRLKTDPKQLLIEAGIPAPVFDSLAKSGVPFESIDHLALGLTLPPDNALPGLALVVALNDAPADPSGLVKRIEKEKLFNLLPVSATVVNGRFLLVGTDLKVFPATPKPVGGEHLPTSLRETALKQISPAAVAWLATESQSWADLPGVKAVLLAANRPDLSPLFSKGRGLALSFSLEPEFNIGLAVKCDGEATAKSLRDHFGMKGAGQPWLVGGEESWATLDAATPPKDVPDLLKRLLPTKK